MFARELEIAATVGAAVIVGLVGIVWRAVAGKRSYSRSRPADPENLDIEGLDRWWHESERRRRETLRAIAAASYSRQTTREHDRKDRR